MKHHRKLALSFPETIEAPHFETTSFRVAKKIIATLDLENHLVFVKLSEIDQDVFSAFDWSIIYPVANKWGRQGCIMVDFGKISFGLFTDVLTCGYCNVAPKILVVLVRRNPGD